VFLDLFWPVDLLTEKISDGPLCYADTSWTTNPTLDRTQGRELKGHAQYQDFSSFLWTTGPPLAHLNHVDNHCLVPTVIQQTKRNYAKWICKFAITWLSNIRFLGTLRSDLSWHGVNRTFFFYNFDDSNWRQAKPELHFLPGQLRWTLLPKERYGNSLSGRGSNTQPFNWEADTLPLS